MADGKFHLFKDSCGRFESKSITKITQRLPEVVDGLAKTNMMNKGKLLIRCSRSVTGFLIIGSNIINSYEFESHNAMFTIMALYLSWQRTDRRFVEYVNQTTFKRQEVVKILILRKIFIYGSNPTSVTRNYSQLVRVRFEKVNVKDTGAVPVTSTIYYGKDAGSIPARESSQGGPGSLRG